MFKVLSAANIQTESDLFFSMHRLRHRVFVEELKWPLGAIRSEDGMEFDQFDIEAAHYIVRVNDSGQVDACTRLLPSTGPFLLGDVFPDLIASMPRPNSPEIWETSRFCADPSTAPKNIVGQLVAAMLEFGIHHGLKHYVSVSDVRIEPLLRRCGWTPQRIGGPRPTGTDNAAGEIFEVSEVALEKVRMCSGIHFPLLDFGVPFPMVIPDTNQEGVRVSR